jgi:general secretion pathway protein D
VRRESDVRTPTSTPTPGVTQSAPPPTVQNPPPAAQMPNAGSANSAVPADGGAPAPTDGAQAKIRFEPQGVSLKPGQTTTIGIVVDNVNDLYSIPLLLQYNPAVVSIEEVQHGGFLSGGTQEIAIVSRVDKEHGQAIISATRQPNTPGVNGSGTLMGIVVKGIAPGTSNLSIVQVNAKDSQQKPIPLCRSSLSENAEFPCYGALKTLLASNAFQVRVG